MNYDERNLSERALSDMEDDISFQCTRYHIPGYDYDDLKQECRLRLWQQLCNDKFNVYLGPKFRTWGNFVIKNHLNNLLRGVSRDERRSAVYINIREQLILEDTNGQEENTSGDIQG